MTQGYQPVAHQDQRRAAWQLVLLGAILMVLLAILLLFVFATPLSDGLGSTVAGNIVPPDTQEAAITAFTPTASLGEAAALSGRGEGLDCSIDAIVQHTAFRHPDGGVSVNLRYRQACVAHDYCYRHGAVTYGYTQADCDGNLARAALRVCRQTKDAADCLTQVRKVYAGLAVGGAGSFRPARPDLLLPGEVRSTPKEHADVCRKATPDDPPSPQAFAYPAWPDALYSRFEPGWFDSPQRRDYRLALARCYDQLSPDGVHTLLAAWMDLASTAGEYDPFPLGTASVAIPRLLRLNSQTDGLVFYWQRPSGVRLISFGWAPTDRPGVLIACRDGKTCVGPTRSSQMPQAFDFRPGPPWVARLGNKQDVLVWWRRQLTGADPTGGRLELMHATPNGTMAPAQWDRWTDLCGSTVFPFERTPAALSVVAIDPSDCEDKKGTNIRNVRHPLLRYRSVDPRYATLPWRWGRAYLPKLKELSTWLANPPTIESTIIPASSAGGSAPMPGLTFTTFRRLPDEFRQKLESSSWSIPADFKPRFDMPRATGPASATYMTSEAAEPYAALRGKDRVLRLLTVQCAPGRHASERCSHAHDGTVVTLWSPLGRPEVKPLSLPRSYAMMRAIVVRRSDFPQFTGPGSYVLLLTRTTISRDTRGYRLDGYLDPIAVSDTGLVDLGEVALGALAFASSLSEALPIASRLFPLADDVDGDGLPDIVIADPQSGQASLAFLNPLHILIARTPSAGAQASSRPPS